MNAHDRLRMTVEDAARDKRAERVQILGTDVGEHPAIRLHDNALSALNAAEDLERQGPRNADTVENLRRLAWELALGARLEAPR